MSGVKMANCEAGNTPVNVNDRLREEKVTVGCMIFLSLFLGGLLVHGAIRSMYDRSVLHFVMNIGGIFAVVSFACLIWSAYNLMKVNRVRERHLFLPNAAEGHLAARMVSTCRVANPSSSRKTR
ncbi:MAG: hypothetical protein ACTJLL_02705 [Anaplasma sp.]